MVRTNGLDKLEGDSGMDMGMSGYMKAWFVFVGLLSVAMIAGAVYVVYLLLVHFNVLVMGGLL